MSTIMIRQARVQQNKGQIAVYQYTMHSAFMHALYYMQLYMLSVWYTLLLV